jgi:hypothetical protein
MINLLLIWAALGIAFMLIGIREGSHSAGLPFAYFLGLSLIHAPGAAAYIHFPAWDALADRTYVGFELTLLGMAVFLAAVLAVRFFANPSAAHQLSAGARTEDLALVDRLSLIYLFGGICYFTMGSLVNIPSIGAFVASLSSLLVVGASLRIWVAREQHNARKLFFALLLLPLLPLITMVRSGFIGFGTYWLLSIICFAFAQTKRRFIYFVLAPAFLFVGLSLFVSYMASRAELRRAVWFQQVGIADRLDHVADIFRKFQWLDGEDEQQRELIDSRLNQNLLVAAAKERLDSGFIGYANGSTLVDMAIGLIPRAIWPDKPQVGGGGTVVRDYAGMRFAEGTSVGAGQVLEFYVNFGTIGVVCGFLIYGLLIGWMDLRVMECLYSGNHKGALLWFTMCLALLQPGGNLLEITVSFVGSAVTAQLIYYLVIRRLENRQRLKSLSPASLARVGRRVLHS